MMFARVKIFLEMIKFHHTVFALPFAFTGAILAAKGLPGASQSFWIIIAMVGARTAAMGFNRLIDAEIDAQNPRTSGRAIPAGLLGKGSVVLFVVIFSMLFVFASFRLNLLCFYLSLPALALLALYSYCKRFTSLSHLVLGACLAAAPLGAWIAVTGSLGVPAILLGVGVLFWVAGFDILYALQDLDFDRSAGLYSIPASLGITSSLRMARLFHLVLPVVLVTICYLLNLGPLFICGILASTIMLAYEHWLLRDADLRMLDNAFFKTNGYISLVIFIFTLGDLLWRQAKI